MLAANDKIQASNQCIFDSFSVSRALRIFKCDCWSKQILFFALNNEMCQHLEDMYNCDPITVN